MTTTITTMLQQHWSCVDLSVGLQDTDYVLRLVGVGSLVSFFPLLAFLYSVIVYGTYGYFREIPWTQTKLLQDIFVRWILVVAAWFASIVITTLVCVSCPNDSSSSSNSSNDMAGCWIACTAITALVFVGSGLHLVMKTRNEAVVGISRTTPVPIFYGTNNLTGKYIVITGANEGIGKETARQCAAQGATILLLCRHPIRAQRAMDSIREQQQHLYLEDPTRYPTRTIRKDQLIYVPCDLANFHSIRHAVTCLQQHLEIKTQALQRVFQLQASSPTTNEVNIVPKQYIYSVICNAGVMMGTQTFSRHTNNNHNTDDADGCNYETMMQTNHLGHFLLVKLMIEKQLVKTTIDTTLTKRMDEPSRICIVTSSTYEFSCGSSGNGSTGGFDFDDPFCTNGLRPYTLFGQYSMTKLANLLLAKELAKRYNTNAIDNGSSNSTKPALAVFAIHPGIVCRTNVTSHMNWFVRYLNQLFGWLITAISKTPEQGAYSIAYIVSVPTLAALYDSLSLSLASSPEEDGTHNSRTGSTRSRSSMEDAPYIVNCQQRPTQEYITHPLGGVQDANKLWSWSEQMIAAATDETRKDRSNSSSNSSITNGEDKKEQ